MTHRLHIILTSVFIPFLFHDVKKNLLFMCPYKARGVVVPDGLGVAKCL